MSSSAERLWASILKDVQYIVQHSAERSEAVFDKTATAVDNNCSRFNKLGEQPSLARAIWKKLISDLKVGLRVGYACHGHC